MSGLITCWFDINSPYSNYAFRHLRNQAPNLAKHNIDFDVKPVFINGLNVGSGNKPPWTLPAKAAYSEFDSKRAQKYFGAPPMSAPPEFPVKSLPVLRAMCYVKATYPKQKFEDSFMELWKGVWEEHLNLSDPAHFQAVLERYFTNEAAQTIVKAGSEKKWKDQLAANTEEALSRGAYGAPWFWVRNSKGEEEPFFGSDRFHYMWDYLNIPHRDFEVLGSREIKL